MFEGLLQTLTQELMGSCRLDFVMHKAKLKHELFSRNYLFVLAFDVRCLGLKDRHCSPIICLLWSIGQASVENDLPSVHFVTEKSFLTTVDDPRIVRSFFFAELEKVAQNLGVNIVVQ